VQVWERLDEEVATTPMPHEYRNWQVRDQHMFLPHMLQRWHTRNEGGACHGGTNLLSLTVSSIILQVELLCNDCQHSSRVRFHIVGQKCPASGCGSYNSRRVTIVRIPADAPEDAIPELPLPQQAAAPPADA
jgi:Zinc-ribbon